MSERPPPPFSPGPQLTLVERFRLAPATYAFCAINIAVFLYVERHGGTTDIATLIKYGAEERGHLWNGELWRLATPMFLHIGWIHLLINTWAIPSWCRPIERIVGSPMFAVAYLAAGIGGTALSVLAHDVPGSAGASGAGFGLIGLTLVFRYRQLGNFGAFTADRGVRTTLITLAIWTAIGMTAVKMNNFAHGGGFLVGALFGVALFAARRIGRPAAFGAFAVFVLGLSAAAAHRWPGQTAIWGAHQDFAEGNEAMKRDDPRAALPFYERAEAQGADVAQTEFNRALAFERLGDVAAAREAYGRAAAAEGANPEARARAKERLAELAPKP